MTETLLWRRRSPGPIAGAGCAALLMIGGPLAVLIGVGIVYLNGGRYADTDNAYVHTHKVSVSADISGRVVDLKVHENQPVKKGDVLFQLDPEPLQIAVDQAHANVEDARNKIIGLKAAYRTRQEDLKAAEANLGFAQRELQRREKLVAGKIISQSDYDEARNRYNVAVNEAASIRQDISRIISELGGNPDVDPEDPSDLSHGAGRAGPRPSSTCGAAPWLRRRTAWWRRSMRCGPATTSMPARRSSASSASRTPGSRPTSRRPTSPM